MGAVAYKLELPASATIHNVFHVSQLKAVLVKKKLKAVVGSHQVSPSFPSDLQEF